MSALWTPDTFDPAALDLSATVLDLYAGAGGWDEGARALELPTLGLEIWDTACATAVAAGHPRLRCDITTCPTSLLAGIRKMVGSPPCQAWSQAGKQLGRVDRARVHALVDAYAAGRDEPWPEGWADERSHHAAQPVRWIRDLRPDWVALEQVPPVLELWQHIAIVLRGWGYRTWVGILNAADYGVPQTRERAILIARQGGPALPPEPTHEREPDDSMLFGCRQKWISMAAALGWLPGAVATGTNSRITRAGETRPYERDVERPAPTLTGNANRWNRLEDDGTPAPTVTSGGTGGGGGVEIFAGPHARARAAAERERAGWVLDTRRGTGYADGGTQTRSVEESAPTLTGQSGDQWVLRTGRQQRSTERDLDEPAGTLFGSRSGNVHWSRRRPATTVVGDPRIGRPGHKDRAGGESYYETDAVKITLAEASILQSFRPDYPWQGTRNECYLQVGNAFPPLLAQRVIAAAEGRWAA